MKRLTDYTSRLSLVGVLTVLLFVSSLVRADELAEARELFNVASYTDNADASEKALTSFRQLYDAHPGNPLIVAYLGAAESLAGRYAWMPWTKLHHVDTGLAYLDKAQVLASNMPPVPGSAFVTDEVTLVAANTYLDLPEMFNTHERGRSLAATLIGRVEMAEWPVGFRCAVYLLAARAAESDGKRVDALKWLAGARELVDPFNRLALKAMEEALK